MSMKERLREFLLRETDARPVALVRILIGLAALTRGLEAARILDDVLRPHIVRLPYLVHLPELPRTLIPVFAGLWCTAAALFTVGRFTRSGGALLLALMAYCLLLDQQTYSN